MFGQQSDTDFLSFWGETHWKPRTPALLPFNDWGSTFQCKYTGLYKGEKAIIAAQQRPVYPEAKSFSTYSNSVATNPSLCHHCSHKKSGAINFVLHFGGLAEVQ